MTSIDVRQHWPSVQKARKRFAEGKDPALISKKGQLLPLGTCRMYRQFPKKWDLEELWESISVKKATEMVEDRVGEWIPDEDGAPVFVCKSIELLEAFKATGPVTPTPKLKKHNKVGGGQGGRAIGLWV